MFRWEFYLFDLFTTNLVASSTGIAFYPVCMADCQTAAFSRSLGRSDNLLFFQTDSYLITEHFAVFF